MTTPDEAPAPVDVPGANVTVPAPVSGLDPRISLATAIHAGSGVYALLLGSGISSAAGIPTGWAIVTDLVRQAAAAANPSEEVPADLDTAGWWSENGTGELGYSSLLESLGSSGGGRDQLLRRYFETAVEGGEEILKEPTAAHHAIAELVHRGAIKVIVTTNFDRLLERALEARGIQPQVIHRADQVGGMTPLVHARATIIKLHGDYADLDKRNTIDELETYPPEMAALLSRILEEYGLVVSGWSGEWDTALIRSLEELHARRYPLFWATLTASPTPSAARLISQLGAVHIPGTDADTLFGELREQLDAINRLGAVPLTRELAVARLKRYLPDPVRRIDLHDLVMDALTALERKLNDLERYPVYIAGTEEELLARYQDQIAQYRADSDLLLHLLANGAYYGNEQQHPLWSAVVGRLLATLDTSAGGRQQELLTELRRYPALLAATTLLATGSLAGKHDLVVPVLVQPKYKTPFMNEEEPAAHGVHVWRVSSRDAVNQMPRWESRWLYPVSHLVRVELDGLIAEFEPNPTRRAGAMDVAEYLTCVADVATGDRPAPGEFLIHSRRTDRLDVAAKLRSELVDADGPLLRGLFGGNAGSATTTLDDLDAKLIQHANNNW